MLKTADHVPDFRLNRHFDQFVFAELPGTLKLFRRDVLRRQFHEMSVSAKALCFTLLVPIPAEPDAKVPPTPGCATALVCLHASPDVARRGVESFIALLEQSDQERAPLAELQAPIRSAHASARSSGVYREAVYGAADGQSYFSITSHTPPPFSADLASIVGRATNGSHVDLVVTIAVTERSPVSGAPAAAVRRALH